MTSVTLCGGRVFSPALGSVIVGGKAEANTVMLSRDGLFARRGLLVLAWLLGGLKVFLSLSVSTLAVEAAPTEDAPWKGRTSVSVSRLRLGLVVRVDIALVQAAGAVARFRFGGRLSGSNGGDRFWIQSPTNDIFAAAIEGDNGGVAAMMVGLSGGCLPVKQRSYARYLTRLSITLRCVVLETGAVLCGGVAR
jgi:hypothetical protein